MSNPYDSMDEAVVGIAPSLLAELMHLRAAEVTRGRLAEADEIARAVQGNGLLNKAWRQPAAQKQVGNLSSLLDMQERRTAGGSTGNALITMALLNRMQDQLAAGDTEGANTTGGAIVLHRIATTVADTADSGNEALRALRTAVGAPTGKNFAAAGAAAKSALLRGPVAGLGSLITLAMVTRAMKNRAASADDVGVVLPELE